SFLLPYFFIVAFDLDELHSCFLYFYSSLNSKYHKILLNFTLVLGTTACSFLTHFSYETEMDVIKQ
uniref:Uncharacterized protein n=1 Tax=Oryza brachyantha TaxID=4533 RepID=J3MXW8_ORYBR